MSTQGRAQFTPGPWVGYTNTDEGRHIISEAYAQDVIVCEQVHTDADISIIAAAPAMYEALQALLALIGDEDLPDNGELSGASICDFARSALAQAEGRQA